MNLEKAFHHGEHGDTAEKARRREQSKFCAMGELSDIRFEFRRVAVPAVVQMGFPG